MVWIEDTYNIVKYINICICEYFKYVICYCIIMCQNFITIIYKIIINK